MSQKSLKYNKLLIKGLLFHLHLHYTSNNSMLWAMLCNIQVECKLKIVYLVDKI